MIGGIGERIKRSGDYRSLVGRGGLTGGESVRRVAEQAAVHRHGRRQFRLQEGILFQVFQSSK